MCGNPHDVTNNGCRGRGGRLWRFIQPRLLLQLVQKSAHGYELMDVTNTEDERGTHPGGPYRILRTREEDGVVKSNWETHGGGPARRMYQITEQGVEHLHAWMVSICNTRQLLDDFLREYETCFSKERNTEHV